MQAPAGDCTPQQEICQNLTLARLLTDHPYPHRYIRPDTGMIPPSLGIPLLLGAVMYDYKGKYILNSPKTIAKKESLVQKLRINLGVPTLADEFTHTAKAYFDVSKCV